jgi:uncharacterized protein with PQ loop repeat
MIEFVGWLGSLCFAVCALPQVIQTVKEKNADGISHGLFWLWFFGEIFTIIYVWFDKYSLPLIVNYVFNLILLSIIGYYKYLYGKVRKTNI